MTNFATEQGKDTASGGESTPQSVVLRAAAVLHEAHRSWNGYGTAGLQSGALYRHMAEALCAEQLLRAEAPATVPGELTVYRVQHDSIVCGLYSNREAAHAHCEAETSDEHPTGTALFFEWCVDEDEPTITELDLRIGDQSTPTGYFVTELTVAPAYEPEADW